MTDSEKSKGDGKAGRPGLMARRWTTVGIIAVALVSLLTAVVFMNRWGDYVDRLAPDYPQQARLWAEAVQRRLELDFNRFVDESPHQTILNWRQRLPVRFRDRFGGPLAGHSMFQESELTLLERRNGSFRSVHTVGAAREVYPDRADYGLEPASGIGVAVRHTESATLAFVEGDLRVRTPVSDAYRFRGVLEFPPFNRVKQRAERYAWILVLVYLGMLYALFFGVFILGRRELTLGFFAKEKEIRLRAIASVAEGIAHEVRNPLNAISLNVQYLERLSEKAGKTPTSQDYQRVYMELGKIRKVIDNFVSFAKLRDIELTDWAMGDAVKEALEPFGPVFEERRIAVSHDVEGDATLTGDRLKIVQVLRGILENAIDAASESEERRIDVRVVGGPRDVRVVVQDTGESPSPEVLQNMFDPYFSTRPSAMGLGLTLARTVVESHGGTIEASAAAGGGCAVTLLLPRRF